MSFLDNSINFLLNIVILHNYAYGNFLEIGKLKPFLLLLDAHDHHFKKQLS